MYSVRAVKNDSAALFMSEAGRWEMLPASCDGSISPQLIPKSHVDGHISLYLWEGSESAGCGWIPRGTIELIRNQADGKGLPLPLRKEGTLPCCSNERRVLGLGASRFRRGVWISRFRGWCVACLWWREGGLVSFVVWSWWTDDRVLWDISFTYIALENWFFVANIRRVVP